MAKARKKGKVSYGDNLYEIHGSYWLKFTYKGKTYYERIGKVEEMPLTMARNIAIKIKQEIIQGTYLPVKEKGLTFKELAQEYLKWYHSTRPHAKARTSYEIERKTHKLVDYFGTMELSKISTFTIEQYKQHRLSAGVKPNTINSELNILRAILKKAKALKLYSGDLPEVKLFKVDDSRLRFLKSEEFARLLQACPSWLRPAVEFAVYTGLRASEIFSLKWEYVDKGNSKTRSEFECKLCNKKLHADVNASRNLLSRAEWSLHLGRMEQALIKQVEEFMVRLFDERFKCLWSKALGLIERNPYFQSVPKPEVWINVHKKGCLSMLRDTLPLTPCQRLWINLCPEVNL